MTSNSVNSQRNIFLHASLHPFVESSMSSKENKKYSVDPDQLASTEATSGSTMFSKGRIEF